MKNLLLHICEITALVAFVAMILCLAALTL